MWIIVTLSTTCTIIINLLGICSDGDSDSGTLINFNAVFVKCYIRHWAHSLHVSYKIPLHDYTQITLLESLIKNHSKKQLKNVVGRVHKELAL